MEHDMRHGGPFDRGSADNWYGGTGKGNYIGMDGMTEEEIAAYGAGWADNEETGVKKEYAE